MDAFTSRQIEDDYKPPLMWRIIWRIRLGKDDYCDSCGRRTWWNGNVVDDTGIEVVLCDHCHAGFVIGSRHIADRT